MQKRAPVKIVLYSVTLAITVFAVWWLFIRKQHSTTTRNIVIAQTSDFFLYAPLYIASDAGLFERNGVSVRIISTGGDDKTWAAVLSGDADFGISDPAFVAVSAERGVPGKVIASIVNGVPFWGITYDTAIKTITQSKDLKPYAVATFPSPSSAYTLQKKMFLDAGLQPNIKEGGFGTLLAMLKSGQADIALELEPNVSQASADGAKIIYSLANIYGNFAITGLIATPEKLSKDSALAQQVVCAIQQAFDLIHSNRDSALRILAKRFPEIKKEIAKDALLRVISDGIIPTNAMISDSAWEKAIILRKAVGDLKVVGHMNTYVDNSFAERAKNGCKVNN